VTRKLELLRTQPGRAPIPAPAGARGGATARVQLIGYEDQDNLGLRYLSARLRQAGHETRIFALGDDTDALVASVRAYSPYAGTPIEARLQGEGRLDKQDWRADYRFLDPRLDLLYDWGLATFSHRNTARDGTANLLRVLGFEARKPRW
jgi:hypothetical protein